MGRHGLVPGRLWWLGLSLLVGLGLAVAGCTTKAKARLEAQKAFIAGQQQAMARMQQPKEATVQIDGQVRRPVLPWAEDLTLAKAIIAAEYVPVSPPVSIILVRNGQATQIDPNFLLQGKDMPLLPGDIVQLR
jgi:hypothetical protein